MGMGFRHQGWLDDISLAWPIGLGSEDTILNRTNPDTDHPYQNDLFMSQCEEKLGQFM